MQEFDMYEVVPTTVPPEQILPAWVVVLYVCPALTVTVADCDAVPPDPEQETEYVVEVVGDTVTDPEV